MIKKLGASIAGLMTSLLWSTNAFAAGEWGGGAAANPEIDGPGGVMAVALLVGLGIMIYRKAQKK